MKTPKRPAEIDKYQPAYMEGSWAEYTDEEYHAWVQLLTQRATHRASLEEKIKDLTHARNYLLMWLAKVEFQMKEGK